MLELRLIGVHDDGENLVLESADGTRFLQSSLRHDASSRFAGEVLRGLSVHVIFKLVSDRVPA